MENRPIVREEFMRWLVLGALFIFLFGSTARPVVPDQIAGTFQVQPEPVDVVKTSCVTALVGTAIGGLAHFLFPDVYPLVSIAVFAALTASAPILSYPFSVRANAKRARQIQAIIDDLRGLVADLYTEESLSIGPFADRIVWIGRLDAQAELDQFRRSPRGKTWFKRYQARMNQLSPYYFYISAMDQSLCKVIDFFDHFAHRILEPDFYGTKFSSIQRMSLEGVRHKARYGWN